MKPSITRHLLRASNGLEVEMFFDEQAGVLSLQELSAQSEHAFERALPELKRWYLGIIRLWARRTGRHSCFVVTRDSKFWCLETL